MCKQTITPLHNYWYLCVVFLIPTVVRCAYNNQNQAEESQLLLISVEQEHTLNTITLCTEKMLKALLPLEVWHTIMGYLEGNNSFLNTMLARIFIPPDRVRENILASFNSYLAQVNPKQRIKALRLFYTTVRYASQHNILGKTASLTQPLIRAVAGHNFSYACKQLPKLVSLPKEHALYLINHCQKLTDNYELEEHQRSPSVCCHCFYSTVGIMFIFVSIAALTEAQNVPTTLFTLSALYWFCYSFTLCCRMCRLHTLDKFLHILEHYEETITPL